MAGRAGRRGFGYVRKLPSGRWQVSYIGPDTARHVGPVTFEARVDAEAWLTDERRLMSAGTWTAPTVRTALRHANAPVSLGEYAAGWLERRDLKPRTRVLYAALLRRLILPTFAGTPMLAITPTVVADWHHRIGQQTGPTHRAHAYGLLKTVCRTAVDEDVIPNNPCRVRGAGTTTRAKKIRPATLEELVVLTEAMPDRLRAAVLLSSWGGLRFGELTELRRRDLDLKVGLVRVRRAVAWVDGQPIVGTPKSAAGVRDVHLPPHLLPALRDHLAEHAAWGRDGLLFPAVGGGHLAESSLNARWYPAREAAGRPDLRWHDLRHTGAVLAAATGATLAELMARLGHSTPAAALRYQHVAQDRDAIIAAKLSELAGGAQ